MIDMALVWLSVTSSRKSRCRANWRGSSLAVSAAYRDGKVWVLDNQIKQVVTAEIIRHYRPLFSLNEDTWWLHRR